VKRASAPSAHTPFRAFVHRVLSAWRRLPFACASHAHRGLGSRSDADFGRGPCLAKPLDELSPERTSNIMKLAARYAALALALSAAGVAADSRAAEVVQPTPLPGVSLSPTAQATIVLPNTGSGQRQAESTSPAAEEWSVRINGWQQAYATSKVASLDFGNAADRPKTEAACGQVVLNAIFYTHTANDNTWHVGKAQAQYKAIWDKTQLLCMPQASYSVAYDHNIDAVVVRGGVSVAGAVKKVAVRGYMY
jgi:hypothetical protein